MTAAVELAPLAEHDKDVLANLLQLYRYDFAGVRNYAITPHGTYTYRYLDHYFVEPEREACLAWASGELVGFTMSRQVEAGAREVAEFFVLRHRRRDGVGSAMAEALFARHPGQWVVAFDDANHEGASFWPALVERVASGTVQRSPKAPGSTYPGQELRFTVAAGAGAEGAER